MKPIATAHKVRMELDRVRNADTRKAIESSLNSARLFGVIYLAPCCKHIKAIENLGFRFKRKKMGNTNYYVLQDR